MKLSSKLTLVRIFLSLIIIILLLFPFESAGIEFPKLFINELIVVNIKYLIAGAIFLLAIVADYFDTKVAEQRKEDSSFTKALDSMTTKILVSSVLIILSAQGFIHPIIPVIIVIRDSIVNSIKILVDTTGRSHRSILLSKVKNYCLLLGIALTLFYNLPFELFNIKVSDILLIIATVLSVISGLQYYSMDKNLLKKL